MGGWVGVYSSPQVAAAETCTQQLHSCLGERARRLTPLQTNHTSRILLKEHHLPAWSSASQSTSQREAPNASAHHDHLRNPQIATAALWPAHSRAVRAHTHAQLYCMHTGAWRGCNHCSDLSKNSVLHTL